MSRDVLEKTEYSTSNFNDLKKSYLSFAVCETGGFFRGSFFFVGKKRCRRHVALFFFVGEKIPSTIPEMSEIVFLVEGKTNARLGNVGNVENVAECQPSRGRTSIGAHVQKISKNTCSVYRLPIRSWPQYANACLAVRRMVGY